LPQQQQQDELLFPEPALQPHDRERELEEAQLRQQRKDAEDLELAKQFLLSLEEYRQLRADQEQQQRDAQLAKALAEGELAAAVQVQAAQQQQRQGAMVLGGGGAGGGDWIPSPGFLSACFSSPVAEPDSSSFLLKQQ